MRFRHLLLLPVVLLAGSVRPAVGSAEPVLHEPIVADAPDDLAMGVSVYGALTGVITTPRGEVPAPDPTRLPRVEETLASVADRRDTFTPDRDTSAKDVAASKDPFSPRVSPFVRVRAFDAVDEHFALRVMSQERYPVVPLAAAVPSDDRFYGDMVVELAAGRAVPIPTVGPDTRLVNARLGVGTRTLVFGISSDSAGNWFVSANDTARARLVVEVAVARAAFGGDFADSSWADLPSILPLPDNVARAASVVTRKLGVSHAKRPREVIAKLVAYFRAFTDSDAHPPPEVDVYTDLALAQKGVCRHRAYAFTITALSLGLPTRMVTSDVHAWVEVHDGARWRRIDLGGAGRQPQEQSVGASEAYVPPPDPFQWPAQGPRSDGGPRNGPPSPTTGQPAPPTAPSVTPGPSQAATTLSAPARDRDDDRPDTRLALSLGQSSAVRGGELQISGAAESDGEPCPNLPIEVVLRDSAAAGEVTVGAAATDRLGRFSSTLVLPHNLALGACFAFVRTRGDTRCGPGVSR